MWSVTSCEEPWQLERPRRKSAGVRSQAQQPVYSSSELLCGTSPPIMGYEWPLGAVTSAWERNCDCQWPQHYVRGEGDSEWGWQYREAWWGQWWGRGHSPGLPGASWYCRGPGSRMRRSQGAVATPQCPRGPPMSTSRAAWGSRAGQSDISVIQVNSSEQSVINEHHDDYQLWGIIMSWMWKFHLIMWTFLSWINNRLNNFDSRKFTQG